MPFWFIESGQFSQCHSHPLQPRGLLSQTPASVISHKEKNSAVKKMFNFASQHVQRPQCLSQDIRQRWLSCRMHLHRKVPFSWGMWAQGDAHTVVGPAGTGRADGGQESSSLGGHCGRAGWLQSPSRVPSPGPGVPAAMAARLVRCPEPLPTGAARPPALLCGGLRRLRGQ